MKKNYKTFIALCFAIIGLGISQPASTQPLLNDSFDYTAGNLYNQGNWWRYGTATENPIQTTETGLVYAGYQDANVGRAAELGNLTLSESLVKKFTEGSEAITSGTLYYSALIQVKSAEEKENSILAFISKTYSSDVADGKKGNEYGKLFVKKGSSEGKFTLGVERYSLSPAMTTEEYELNQTYLVVVKYEFIDGDNNDVISLFVNPADMETEPAEASAVFNGEIGGDVNFGIQGIELRQGATSSKPAANVIVDELRVATSYAALFNVDTPVEPQPQIIAEETIYFMYNYIYQGATYEATLNVKAENLKGDITIAPLTTGEITLSTMTITKEQAEAEEGFDLTLTLTCTDASIMGETLTLSSEGAEDVEVSVAWWPTAVIDVPDLATLAGKDATAYETYRYTGKAIVTFVDGNNYYLQDETAGFRINNEYGGFESVKAGDQFTNFYCYIESYFGAMYASPAQEAPLPEVTASEQTVEPAVLTLAELGANLDKYVNMLVQVKDVTLTEVAGETFTEEMTNPLISDGTGEGRLNLFDGTDIIGTTAPQNAFTLTGISTSAGAVVVGPRRLTDIETNDVSIEDALTNGLSITAQAGSIRIQGDATGKMEVFDLTGRKVAETEESEIRIAHPAIYLVKFTTESGSITRKLYVK